MCGIVGLLVKRDELRGRLGQLVTPMLDCMGTRGPDSAGLAVFHDPLEGPQRRFGLFTAQVGFDWQLFHTEFLCNTGSEGSIRSVESHAVEISSVTLETFKAWLTKAYPDVHLISVGRAIEVYKDEGHPSEIAQRFHFTELTGTHAIGHTRMATESAVSPAHAHPYTAGEDFCLVHNGSLSNPYSIRRKLENRGIVFETDNDTEAGCRFLEWRMREGDTLEQAIETSFRELDGFFTFLMATSDRMVLVRDAFACKPAVAAETDDYVAVSSEFRSLAHLPNISLAKVFEPAPEQIYSWTL
ncbi:MAG: class II glutamine amidotransferase [Pirellulaceae bacterium]|nr:class II glutamine amidotransferase [Pirellulaceae bacterium]MDP6553741.1 class II glutamine amidotransferase [Pirellulaceae bacterium]